MRVAADVCSCFPTGRHYPGISEWLAKAIIIVEGLCREFQPAVVWSRCSFAVIDFETTGLDPERDRVMEIGVVCFDDGVPTASRHWLLNPGIPVPEEARAVHGITDEDIKDAPRFPEIASDLVELLRGRIPVAYNAEFDRAFLHAECRRLGLCDIEDSPPALRNDVVWVDPLVWVRELQKYEKGKKLTDVCARLGLALERAHRAAGDADAAGRVLLTLAPQMPRTYGELIRLQMQCNVRQEVDRVAWRNRRV
jgi:DNA polymerase III subunit epsilon